MEIYLDANATTPVLPIARSAAIAAMSGDFGNPSSVHGSGLKARAMLAAVRATARRVLGAPTGELIFVSGATEGIQMAVLSALAALRSRRDRGETIPDLLLYGATEHKAVPEALHHWNALLQLNLEVMAIPVDRDGHHRLDWLREHAPRAGLVCTMAANNETGVISELDGIEAALQGSPALWMVDGVQALGKLPLRLAERPIDYAAFSGHKLYAPKGIGLLYVREGAPITPLIVGGGQEGALRSGTENMPGIAALGAVLEQLEQGRLFKSNAILESYRQTLNSALRDAFPGIVFNADPALSLPTTLNFSVPGVSSAVLLDLFDAASIRMSGGSACGASKSRPSYVVEAMGLEAWRSASAVRLSFGPATDAGLISEACERIRSCGVSWRESGLTSAKAGLEGNADATAHSTTACGTRAEGLGQLPAVGLDARDLLARAGKGEKLVLVDVREPYEQRLGGLPALGGNTRRQAVPLAALVDALPAWRAGQADTSLVLFCRSGNRSAQGARALRRLGLDRVWSLAGGVALWPDRLDPLDPPAPLVT